MEDPCEHLQSSVPVTQTGALSPMHPLPRHKLQLCQCLGTRCCRHAAGASAAGEREELKVCQGRPEQLQSRGHATAAPNAGPEFIQAKENGATFNVLSFFPGFITYQFIFPYYMNPSILFLIHLTYSYFPFIPLPT